MSRSVTTRKTPIQLYILPLIALIGIGISVALTQHFYSIRNGTAGFKSFCNVNQTMNCDLVAASSSSELFFGLPLSSFGVGWFLALFFVAILAHNPYWRREALRASFALSLLGSLIGLFYLWVMMVQLKTYCLLCLGVDVVNWIALGLTLSLKPEGFSEHKLDIPKWKVIIPLGLGSLAAAVFGLKSMNSMSYRSSDIQELTQSVLGKPPVSVRTGDEYPSIGPKDAPITVVEFSDFQCPFCRVGAYTVHAVMNRYPGKIRVVFRNFPLDQSCNPMMQHTPHPVACEAAKVAICAHKQGKFESVYEELFEKQSSLGSTHPIEMAKAMDINSDLLQSCVASAETGSAISRDLDEGKLLGINSTPTFFINGYKMEGPYPIPVWTQIIDSLLKK